MVTADKVRRQFRWRKTQYLDVWRGVLWESDRGVLVVREGARVTADKVRRQIMRLKLGYLDA